MAEEEVRHLNYVFRKNYEELHSQLPSSQQPVGNNSSW